MKILFIHQNFPGQFKHLAPALAAMPGNQVMTLTMKKGLGKNWQGVSVQHYGAARSSTKGMHPWLADFETKTIRGEACYFAALKLKEQGYYPDVIIAHPGWGESLFLKEVWPDARLGIYCEFFYHVTGADVGFDPEFSSGRLDSPCRIRLKNVNNIMHFDLADAGISPTRWQASTFPETFRSKISVIHDGIDTQRLRPNRRVGVKLNEKLTLTRADEVITFVNRDLEPTRGYHSFMRALPEILERRPSARVFLVGGDGVSYGAKNSSGKSWKQHFIDKIRPSIPDADWQRVHFVGRLPYPEFISLLQLSSVHVYLTYPFVLSWSLLEAMSIGCAIVASDTSPLHEAIKHNETGRLVDFFDYGALANEVVNLLGKPDERERLGKNAREFAVENFDLQTRCLPAQIAWVQALGRAAAVGKSENKQTDSVISRETLYIAALGHKKSAGVTEARVDYPMEALNARNGVKAIWSDDVLRLPSEWPSGVLILHRKFLNERRFVEHMEQLASKGWILVSDMDDDPHHWREFVESDFYAFRGVHAVTVSAEPLAEMVRQWNPHVRVFSNGINKVPDFPACCPKQAQKIHIFFGALNRERDWKPLLDGILTAIDNVKQAIEFVVVHDRAFFEALPSTVGKTFYETQPHDNYMTLLSSCDINLLPLADTPFNRVKSDIKLIESCAAGAVPVCSPVVYGDNPRHEDVAVFATTAREWGEALTRLCEDTETLKRYRQQGYAYVVNQRLHSLQAEEREQFYRALIADREKLEEERQQRLASLKADAPGTDWS